MVIEIDIGNPKELMKVGRKLLERITLPALDDVLNLMHPDADQTEPYFDGLIAFCAAMLTKISAKHSLRELQRGDII